MYLSHYTDYATPTPSCLRKINHILKQICGRMKRHFFTISPVKYCVKVVMNIIVFCDI